MIKRIGKLPKPNAYAAGGKFASFMSGKGGDALEGIAGSVAEIGNIMNSIDSGNYAKLDPSLTAGVGTNTASKFIPFKFSMSKSGGNYLSSITPKALKDLAVGNTTNSSVLTAENPYSDDIYLFSTNNAPELVQTFDAGGYLLAADSALKIGTDAIANYRSKSSIKNTTGISQGIGSLSGTQFAGSNESLLNQFGSGPHYGNVGWKSLLNVSSKFTAGDALLAVGSSMEGLKGGASFGPWGAAIGAVVGGASSLLTSIFGRRKAGQRAKLRANILNLAGQAANAAVANSFTTAARNNDAQSFRNAQIQFGSMNTGLGTGAVSAAYGGNIFDDGGFLASHGALWNSGLNKFKEGGTHELNPLGGIPLGIDPQGTPNLVEEGEYKWTDPTGEWGTYIFSNRLDMPREFSRKYKIGGKVSFAKGIEKYLKRNSVNDMVNDPISEATTAKFLAEAAELLENIRQELEIKEFIKELKKMSPEEQLAVLQKLQQIDQLEMMQQQLAQQAQEQLAMQELQMAMLQQPMAPELAMAMPLEQMAPEGMPSAEQGQPLMEAQGPAMANGGKIFAKGGKVLAPEQMMTNAEADPTGAAAQLLAEPNAEEPSPEQLEQELLQEQQEEVAQKEEETSEEQLDEQIDLIVQYAKETNNKELLLGARQAYRGSKEEKKSFIERANLVMQEDLQRESELRNKEAEQTNELMAEQNAQMEAQLEQQLAPALPEGDPLQMLQMQLMQLMAAAQEGQPQMFAKGGSMSLNNPSGGNVTPNGKVFGGDSDYLKFLKELEKAHLAEQYYTGVLPDYVGDKFNEEYGNAFLKYAKAGLRGTQEQDMKKWGLTPTDVVTKHGGDVEKALAYKVAEDKARKDIKHAYRGTNLSDADRQYLMDLRTNYYISNTNESAVKGARNLGTLRNQLDYDLNSRALTARYGDVTPLNTASLSGKLWSDLNDEQRELLTHPGESTDSNEYYVKRNGVNTRLGFNPAESDVSSYYTLVGEPEPFENEDGTKTTKYVYAALPTTNRYLRSLTPDGTYEYRPLTEAQAATLKYTGLELDRRYLAAPGVENVDLYYEVPAEELYTALFERRPVLNRIGRLADKQWKNIGETAQFMYQRANPPNTSYLNNALRLGDAVANIGYTPNGNYVSPMLIDPSRAELANEHARRAAMRAAQDSSNGSNQRYFNNALAANYAAQLGRAADYTEGLKYNAELMKWASEHNANIDAANSKGMLEADATNQQKGLKVADLYATIGKELTDSEASWKAGVAQGLNRMLSGLSRGSDKYEDLKEAYLKKLLSNP